MNSVKYGINSVSGGSIREGFDGLRYARCFAQKIANECGEGMVIYSYSPER